MPVDQYSLEQAEEDTGRTRGDVDRLGEILTQKDYTSPPPNTPAGGYSLFSSGGTPQIVRPSGYTGAVGVSLIDNTGRTVTGTGATQLGGNFSITAADVAAATTFRYVAQGTGQWGSTQQQLTLIDSLAATNVNQLNVAAAAFSASAPVDWELVTYIVIKTTGAGGTCNVRLTLSMSVNNAAATGSNGVIACRQTGGVAINTTIANTFQLNALWASTTGAPTITCNTTVFERLGP